MKQSISYCLPVLLIHFNLSFCAQIHLNQGKIQGFYNILENYWSYLGVPYASYKGRFKEPGDPPLWRDTFIANRGDLYCKQYSPATKTMKGKEDCLTLNIYTPIAPLDNRAKPLSVIFFIPGGGFYKGSNTDTSYNPRYLVQKDVVVVTINYRVGAFGFLCLKNNGAAGNMGLKDQLAALRWVKNNIANFGGDPYSVTIFGESAGASSVDYIVSTQIAKGLFNRAIMDSGTTLTMQAYDIDPISTASEAANRWGYDTTNPHDLLNIFLNATADEVAKVSVKDHTNNPLAPYVFKPCAEAPNTSDTPILTTSPRKLIKSLKDISNISAIIGYNSIEGIYWASSYDSDGLKLLDKDFSSAIPKTFRFKKPEYKECFVNDIREFYFNNSLINYRRLVDYFTDVLIIGPSTSTMEAYMTNLNIVMYNYYFDYDSLRNLVKMQSKLRYETRGACHADELFYMFDPLVYRYLPTIPADRVMIDRLTTLWTNFAKTGLPSTYMGVAWPRSENTLKFLNFDKETKVISLPNKNRVEFWQNVYEKYLIVE